MASSYYSKLTKHLRRKGIEDARIVSTLNDVKGWIVAHPEDRPEEHFGPAAALARDMPKGNAIHASQKLIAGGIAVGVSLLLLQIIAGFFNVALGFLGLPFALWGLIAIFGSAVGSLFVGGKLPENFRP